VENGWLVGWLVGWLMRREWLANEISPVPGRIIVCNWNT
jgi:hypothetical protein